MVRFKVMQSSMTLKFQVLLPGFELTVLELTFFLYYWKTSFEK